MDASGPGFMTPLPERQQADGTRLPVLLDITVLRDSDGVPLSRVALDLSERKRIEAQVRDLNADLERRVARRTAELAAANQDLDSFAYAVSHDLRAPLRAMRGFATALQEDLGAVGPDAASHLDPIDAASARLGQMIDGILTLSRGCRGRSAWTCPR